MPHNTSLIATLVAGLGLAFVFGAIAQRLRLSPLVGYLFAGVVIGPFTPGYVADQSLAPQLAELGVILLMFGVGLHFSLKDLMSVKAIAVPGAVGQITLATLMGMSLALWLGWGLGAGLVFGLALSVASTVVLLRALQERKLIESERGRIAVGWLIVEDLAMVLALVLLPALSGALGGKAESQAPLGLVSWLVSSGLIVWIDPWSVWTILGLTLLKVAAFVGLMLLVGRRLIPWLLHWVAHTGSRELFRLAVLAIALGVAFGSAELFGVSFALGAFFAGMILAESPLSHRAAQETLPLRDAFAVLFFVSVGMLFDPTILIRSPLPVIATVLIIIVGKSIAAFLIVRAFGYSKEVALTISASLAQIGEFSFILAVLGVSLGLLPTAGQDLILAGALISIVLNPVLFVALDRFLPAAVAKDPKPEPVGKAKSPEATAAPAPKFAATELSNHTILVGHGRVGHRVAAALKERGAPFVVIEERADRVERLREQGVEAFLGSAAERGLLDAANVKGAKRIISAIPNPFDVSTLLEKAKAANPELQIVARAHSDAEVEHLKKFGADHIVVGEREIAREMVAFMVRTATARVSGDDAAELAGDSDAFEEARGEALTIGDDGAGEPEGNGDSFKEARRETASSRTERKEPAASPAPGGEAAAVSQAATVAPVAPTIPEPQEKAS